MSSTDRGRISILRLTDPTTAPTAPAFQTLRVTSSSLAYNKETTTSNELDATAQPASTIKVAAKSGGSLSFEWSTGTWTDLIEAAIRGEFSDVVSHTGSVTIAKAAGTLTATGAFTNAKVGQFVLLSGCAAGESYAGAGDSPNNGWWQIKTRTSADAVVVEDPSGKLVDETSPAGTTLKSNRALNGILKVPHAIEEGFLDVQAFLLFLGQYINTMSLSLTAGQILTGEFGFMGSNVMDEQGFGATTATLSVTATSKTIVSTTPIFANAKVGQRVAITGMTNAGNNVTNAAIASVTNDTTIVLGVGATGLVDEATTAGATIQTTTPSWTGTGSYAAATQTSALNATDNVGDLLIDGEVSQVCFRSLSINLNNNLRETACVGQEFPRIDYGTPECTGSFEQLFVNLDLWRKMRDHENMRLDIGLVSSDGASGLHISLPKVNINSDAVDLSGGKNSDVVDKVEFNAQKYTNAASETYYIQICYA